jgi:hypothetical protein
VWVDAQDADPAQIDTRVTSYQGRATHEIRFEPPRGPLLRRAPKATVDWMRLAALTVEGSGDVAADGINSPALSIRLQGSGDVTLRQLEVRELSLALAGSGSAFWAGRGSHPRPGPWSSHLRDSAALTALRQSTHASYVDLPAPPPVS